MSAASPFDASSLIRIASIAGRVLMGGFFALAGLDHFTALERISKGVAARGIPMPRTAIVLASIVQIVAGGLLVAGILPRLSAAALIGFTIVAGFALLDFWNREGEERKSAIGHWQNESCSHRRTSCDRGISAKLNGLPWGC